jgi:hypothetical protein
MAARLPVVALDGPGVREVVEDELNGRLLTHEDPERYAAALDWILTQSPERRNALRRAARATAETLSLPRMAKRELDLYERVIERVRQTRASDGTPWSRTTGRLQAEWSLLSNVAQAATDALEGGSPDVRAP